MRPWWLLAVAWLGCKPPPEPEPLIINADNVARYAPGTITGGPWGCLSTNWMTWGDLDGDGYVDMVSQLGEVVHEPEGERVSIVGMAGWARGPFVADQEPAVLVEGRADPFLGVWAHVGVDDHDGDGEMDLLVPYMAHEGPWYGLGDSGQPDRYGSAWFKGPFPDADPPRRLDDPRLVEAAGESFAGGDFNLDGQRDGFIRSETKQWFWFDSPLPPTHENVAAAFDASSAYGSVLAFNEEDPANPFELFAWDRPINQYMNRKLRSWPDFENGGEIVADELPVAWQPMGDLDGDGKEDKQFMDAIHDPDPEISLTGSGETVTFPNVETRAGLLPLKVEDVNGDGLADVAVRLDSLDYPSDGEGTTFLFLDVAEGGERDLEDAAVRIDGFMAHPLGDIDADGLGDLAMSDGGWSPPDASPWSDAPGRIWILHGSAIRDALANPLPL